VFGCIVPCGNVFFFNNFVTVDQIHPIEANKRTIYSRYNFDGPGTHRRSFICRLWSSFEKLLEPSRMKVWSTSSCSFWLEPWLTNKHCQIKRFYLRKYALSFGQRFKKRGKNYLIILKNVYVQNTKLNFKGKVL